MQNSVLAYLELTTEKYPDYVAVDDGTNQVTFRELRQNALRLANVIHVKGIGSRQPVLVYVPKSTWSIVCFMGILYSGNFYTPTDVTFPFEKVQSVIKQLEPSLVLTDEKHAQKLIDNGVDEDLILRIDQINYENGDVYTAESFIVDTDVAYTLFTSGSTGVPKGVAITHRSIIDYIDWAKECYSIDEKHKIGNQAPFYFDNSTLDIYLMLSTGATLYIISQSFFAFPAKLMTYVVEKQINTIFWVPSMLINVANFNLLESIDCTCLKKVLFAGEVMPNKQLNYWRKHIPNAMYSNLYGPTEITVDCTYYIVDREFSDEEPLPIGYPCRNSDVLIFDDSNHLVTKPNTIGELCVRGSSLAVGYWNNWEKTKEVFVQNPLNTHFPEKIYRTGDLVYLNERGEIMFSGRKDFQIKHMGYRIELGEIETAAMSHEKVKNACCLYDSQNKQIILFYQGDLDDNMIRRHIGTIIPKYMVPTVYHRLDEFPYTSNGKIDRVSLKKQFTI